LTSASQVTGIKRTTNFSTQADRNSESKTSYKIVVRFRSTVYKYSSLSKFSACSLRRIQSSRNGLNWTEISAQFSCVYKTVLSERTGRSGVGKLGRSKVGLGKLGLGKLVFGKLGRGATSKSAW